MNDPPEEAESRVPRRGDATLRRLDVAVLVVGAVVAVLLVTDVWPGLRGPREWRWQRRPFVSPLSLLGSAAVFAAHAFVALRIRRVWAAARGAARAGLLVAAIALVFLQMVMLSSDGLAGAYNARVRAGSHLFSVLVIAAIGCAGDRGAERQPTADSRGASVDAERLDAAQEVGDWLALEPGLELGEFPSPVPSSWGDSVVRVLRIDPDRFDFRLMNASASAGRRLTAKQWCLEHGLVAAVNASMYQEDLLTSVSYMRTRDHVNNARITRDMALFAFDRDGPDVPPVRIIDRECDDLDAWRDKYGTLIQSIRMISCRGENVWSRQPERWSTALIAMDGRGRVLFVHVRSPYSVHDLIDILLALPLDVERAMYAEGGPEAQLYARSGGREYEFVGSYETRIVEDDYDLAAWSVPNVVGIARRATGAPGRELPDDDAGSTVVPDRGAPGRGETDTGAD